MYVRIARFEDAAVTDWDHRIDEVRKRMQTRDMDGPMGSAKRAMMLVDREHGRGASVIFCETEEDLRRVDEAMNQMTRVDGNGVRTGVEMFEIAVDEDFS